MASERHDGEGREAASLRAEADAARGSGRWAEAAALYGAYLAREPGDPAVMVQRGHCLKEAGDPAGALALYREAASLAPGEADIPLQIGHAEKLLGRRAAAAEAYGQAARLAPGRAETWREWRGVLSDLPAARVAGPVLDLSDLVEWFGHRRAPTGIQRVQMEVAAALEGRAGLCAMHPAEEGWRLLPPALFGLLRDLSRGGADEEEEAWREARSTLQAWRRGGAPLKPGAGNVLVTLGSAWWLPHHAAALRQARAAGARHVALLHDCGPLVLDDIADEGMRGEFARWFSALPVLADGVIAVSRATASEGRRLMDRYLPGWVPPPFAVVRPDGMDPALPAPEAAPPAAARRRGFGRLVGAEAGEAARPRPGGLPDEPYVLMVGSLEPRKNHRVALEAWRRMMERRGEAAVPRLVLAGRRAPGDAPLLAMLREDQALSRRVTLLHGVDDAQLARLYRGCLFTLYPSRHEGWGLPVSESLFHRRVPVVSDIPSLRESGEEGAVFVAPGSVEDLAEAVEELAFGPARLAAAEARIPAGGGLRPWAEVAEDLLAAVRRLVAGDPPPWPALPLRRALPFGQAGRTVPDEGMAWAAALPQGEGWGAVEARGMRLRPGLARLDLPVPEEALRVVLEPYAASGSPLLRVEVRRDGAAAGSWEGRAGRDGLVALEVPSGGPSLRILIQSAEAGDAVAGLASVAVLRGGSAEDRVAFLESRLLVAALPA